VEHLVSQIMSGASGTGAYGLVLLVLLLCGLGVPLPEDVVLITGGFLVYQGSVQLPAMIAVAFLGILGGDSIAFLLGRFLGDRATQVWPFRLIVTPSKRNKVEHLFARYGQKIVVAARFMPGVRAVTYFCAGAAGMSYPTFILFDGLAATISAPAFVLLGSHFGGKIDWLVVQLRSGQQVVFGGLFGVLFLWLLARYAKGRLLARRKAAQASLSAPAPAPAAEATVPSVPVASTVGERQGLRAAK
jgi:membrane protein DedA with SNARE-associated domain